MAASNPQVANYFRTRMTETHIQNLVNLIVIHCTLRTVVVCQKVELTFEQKLVPASQGFETNGAGPASDTPRVYWKQYIGIQSYHANIQIAKIV